MAKPPHNNPEIVILAKSCFKKQYLSVLEQIWAWCHHDKLQYPFVRRLLNRLFLLFLPVILVFGFPAGLLSLSGELTPMTELTTRQAQARQQSAPPVLVGLAYTDPAELLKLRGTLDAQPQVLALGTSRALQFRAEMFTPAARFFNAGRAVSKIKHLRLFLNQMPLGREPKVLILGLDQYFFNVNWDNLANDDYARVLAGARQLSAFEIVATHFRQVYEDYASSKISLPMVTAAQPNAQRLGFTALSKNAGFRSDGSYRYPRDDNPQSPTWRDYHYKDTLDRIANGGFRFEPGAEVNAAAVAELKLFLAECQRRNIRVIGYLPPYAHSIYKTMQDSGKFAYLAKIDPSIRPLFAALGYSLFDFSDLASVGASDAETLDGFHGSEKAYARMVLRMAQRDPELARYVDIAALQAAIKQVNDDYIVFGDGF